MGREWETTVYSVAELRRLVVDRYRDPAIVGRRWYRYPAMVGKHLTACPAGHELQRGGGGSTPDEWHRCECGGHLVLRCKPCAYVVLDPPLHPRACRPWQDRLR